MGIFTCCVHGSRSTWRQENTQSPPPPRLFAELCRAAGHEFFSCPPRGGAKGWIKVFLSLSRPLDSLRLPLRFDSCSVVAPGLCPRKRPELGIWGLGQAGASQLDPWSNKSPAMGNGMLPSRSVGPNQNGQLQGRIRFT